jgi:hypothetical protein
MDEITQFSEELEDCATDAALYALSALPADKVSAVELRLRSGCAFCLAQVEDYRRVAEQLSLAVNPAQPSPKLREKLLARIAVQEPTAATNKHRKVVRGSERDWKQLPIPGVEMRPLIGEKTFMLRMQPGAMFPKHNHPQAEQCYVLSGSITDSDGLTLQAGDFVVMSRDTQHDPIHSVAGCTLLISYAD